MNFIENFFKTGGIMMLFVLAFIGYAFEHCIEIAILFVAAIILHVVFKLD